MTNKTIEQDAILGGIYSAVNKSMENKNIVTRKLQALVLERAQSYSNIDQGLIKRRVPHLSNYALAKLYLTLGEVWPEELHRYLEGIYYEGWDPTPNRVFQARTLWEAWEIYTSREEQFENSREVKTLWVDNYRPLGDRYEVVSISQGNGVNTYFFIEQPRDRHQWQKGFSAQGFKNLSQLQREELKRSSKPSYLTPTPPLNKKIKIRIKRFFSFL